MLKLLLVLFTFAGQAPVKFYNVKATSKVFDGNVATCDADKRMMKDKHIILIGDDTVTVNGMEWKVENSAPDLVITYHADKNQNTFLTMTLYVNERGLFGKYYLFGLDSKRRFCFDAVYVEGTRR